MPAGKVGIRIVMFGIVRHRLSLLAQQVPVVQAGVRIVNQNARKKTKPAEAGMLKQTEGNMPDL
ncbi:hypothetical protein [Escherichia coli]|uniref:hypothetical protein n=1 Tax=Escherichia coli TaxID=562 RepID=UPI001370538B|nr:hypothetical protein [Escherichia coli]MXC49203.1 hypothetical protein [Escherichia coli]MXE59280.1 hypothetical protein [Escherichia coli]